MFPKVEGINMDQPSNEIIGLTGLTFLELTSKGPSRWMAKENDIVSNFLLGRFGVLEGSGNRGKSGRFRECIRGNSLGCKERKLSKLEIYTNPLGII